MSVFGDVRTVFSKALHGESFYWLCSDGHALGTEFAWMPASGSWVYVDRDSNGLGQLDDIYLLVTDREDTSDYPWFENVDLIGLELAHNGIIAVSSDIPDELPSHVHIYRVGAPADGLHKELTHVHSTGGTCSLIERLYTYTIAVCDHSGRGTHHVSSYRAPDVETAKEYAIEETASDWGLEDDECLHCLWVAKGDVEIIEYNEGGLDCF